MPLRGLRFGPVSPRARAGFRMVAVLARVREQIANLAGRCRVTSVEEQMHWITGGTATIMPGDRPDDRRPYGSRLGYRAV